MTLPGRNDVRPKLGGGSRRQRAHTAGRGTGARPFHHQHRRIAALPAADCELRARPALFVGEHEAELVAGRESRRDLRGYVDLIPVAGLPRLRVGVKAAARAEDDIGEIRSRRTTRAGPGAPGNSSSRFPTMDLNR